MNRTTLLMLCLLLALPFCAQTIEQYKANRQTKYQQFKSDKQKQYDAYRQKINADYATFMAKRWPAYKSSAAIKKPNDQDLPQPSAKQDTTPPPIDEIRYLMIIVLVPYEMPEPVVPIDVPPSEDKPSFAFSFHGTPCEVHFSDSLRYTLPDASEPSAAAMWRHLSDSSHDALISDCLRLRDQLQLGDWGYINLLQALTKEYYGQDSNEAVLTQMYLLTQSGYNTRIARTDNRFVLLVPFNATLYDYSYFALDGIKYYILDKSDSPRQYCIFDQAFPEEQVPSLRMNHSPQLAYEAVAPRTLYSRRFPNMRATIMENKNLIDFYNEYPLSAKWDYYSMASLSENTKQALYPILRQQIAGKSPYDSANMLINFVQTAFDYQTDRQQFGHERPLFGDETLYYPYSDCEDRSILYSILVRELLDLEVVLLHYPGHLATAVHFPDNKAYGYHFTYDNKVYTICDPTYINADAGDCMPDYRNSSPEVIMIQ